jgi:hypothetical protein
MYVRPRCFEANRCESSQAKRVGVGGALLSKRMIFIDTNIQIVWPQNKTLECNRDPFHANDANFRRGPFHSSNLRMRICTQM